MARRRKIDLTQVKRGTYKRIADELGLSVSHVVHVAVGSRHNVYVERELLKAVRQYKNEQRELTRLRSLIRKDK